MSIMCAVGVIKHNSVSLNNIINSLETVIDNTDEVNKETDNEQ